MKKKTVSMFMGLVLGVTTVFSSIGPAVVTVSAAESGVTDSKCKKTGTPEPAADDVVPDANQYKYQKDELAACRNEQRRTQLLQCMASIGVHTLPTESFCIGVSRIGEARISDGSDLIRKLEGGNPVHIQDALIGETAIKNALTVITNDDRFKKRIAAQGGQALTTEEFLKVLKEPDA